MTAKPSIWRKRAIKILTVLLVTSLLLRPETIHLGLMLDAVGLDTFLLLLEVQFIVLLSLAYRQTLGPLVDAVWRWMRPWLLRHWDRVTETSVAKSVETVVFEQSGLLGTWLFLHAPFRPKSRLIRLDG